MSHIWTKKKKLKNLVYRHNFRHSTKKQKLKKLLNQLQVILFGQLNSLIRSDNPLIFNNPDDQKHLPS